MKEGEASGLSEGAGTPEAAPSEAQFRRIEEAHARGGAAAALSALCEALERDRKYPQLFECLLMQSRSALGLPLIPLGPSSDLPEEVLRPHEDAIARACRLVGGLYLKDGDIVAAWPYFRALGETVPMAAALEAIPPGQKRKDLEEVIEIAFHNSVNPRRGLELILANAGICSAITAMERSPPAAREVQEDCATVLVNELYRELVASVSADISRRESRPAGAPPLPAKLVDLIAGRSWLFAGGGYHADPSHLHAVVRLSAAISRRPALERALELTDYGRQLDPMYHYKTDPPFEDFYQDHALYLRGRLAASPEDIELAVRHFREKARAARARGDDRFPPGVVLEVLVRLGRAGEAIDLSLELDGANPGGPGSGWAGAGGGQPTLGELCQMAGDFGRLAEVARKRGDLLGFTAGLIQQKLGTATYFPDRPTLPSGPTGK